MLNNGSVNGLEEGVANAVKSAASALKAASGRSIAMAGSNGGDIQTIVAAVNQKLGNYGSTIDLSSYLAYRRRCSCFISCRYE